MSKTIVVRYETRPESADENQRLVENVFAELAENDPGGLRYATLRLADGVTYIHIAQVEDADSPNPLAKLTAFDEFQRGIGDRCVVPPALVDATVAGSYRFFSE